MKTIKKAQSGTTVKDKTAVVKPKLKGVIKNEPTYKYADRIITPTKKDSADYKKGFDFGKSQPKNTLQGLVENTAWSIGNLEGRNDKRPQKKISMKSGGSVKAKDGKWMQKAAASIKRRGTEGKCTPITKPGCTGKAKALAKTFKKIAKSNKKK
jgi:hypothetical protein